MALSTGKSWIKLAAKRLPQKAIGRSDHQTRAHHPQRISQHHAGSRRCRVAPSAMRMPISLVRRATVYASSP